MKRGRGGVQYEDELEGVGDVAQRGSRVTIRYTMKLNRGKIVMEDQLAAFRVGQRRVIPGIDYGVEGMRTGGKRRLRVGPHLAYGESGVPDKVPPNAVLEIDLLLLSAEPPVDP